MTVDFICKFMADVFDPPCCFGFRKDEKYFDVDEFMREEWPGWCEEHCDDDYVKCWKKFFETLERTGYGN